jgi:signal transduction histidine kinase/CheY-like chemotaxis protein
VAASGLAAFAGWVLDDPALQALYVRPNVTVKTNMALALAAAGAALVLLVPRPRPRARTAAGRALAALVMVLGAATLSQHLVGWDLGIDQLLFRERPGALATASPNRMGPPGSTSLALLGAALLLLDARSRRAARAREALAAVVVGVALLGLMGYVTGASPFYALARVTGIALLTAVMLVLLAAGVMAARPHHGLPALLARGDEAGQLARRLLVPAFLLPFAAAVALRAGVEAGWLDAPFATAAMAFALTVGLTAVVWRNALDLSRALRARDAAEHARARREEALREAHRRQTEFLAVLSHELRNPLAPMRHALETMAAGAPPSRAHEVLGRQLAHLGRLVDDLLDVSRIASGKVQLQRKRVALRPILDHAVESAMPAIAGARHQLEILPLAEDVWLDADPDRIAQVVTNLLNNAARYTPPGGRITLAAEAAPGEVSIRVRDTGIGLAAGDLERVFAMFVQVAPPGAGGLGIGLPLVRGIVEIHGGTVEAASEGHGRGAEFRIRLPRARPPSADDLVAAPLTVVTTPGPLATRRVLVADDNEDAAEMLRAVLELDGHVVQLARDGVSALDRIAAFGPDVALLDIGMPGLDGYEVARRVRAGGRPIFLVAITGWGQDGDRQRARDAGFDAHLTKPADPDAIRRLLARD